MFGGHPGAGEAQSNPFGAKRKTAIKRNQDVGGSSLYGMPPIPLPGGAGGGLGAAQQPTAALSPNPLFGVSGVAAAAPPTTAPPPFSFGLPSALPTSSVAPSNLLGAPTATTASTFNNPFAVVTPSAPQEAPAPKRPLGAVQETASVFSKTPSASSLFQPTPFSTEAPSFKPSTAFAFKAAGAENPFAPPTSVPAATPLFAAKEKGEEKGNPLPDLFGGQQRTETASNPFAAAPSGSAEVKNLFASVSKPSDPQPASFGGGGGGLFGANKNDENQVPPASSGSGLFGNTDTPAQKNPFGASSAQSSSSSLFGKKSGEANLGGLFGQKKPASGGGGLFGNREEPPKPLFAKPTTEEAKPPQDENSFIGTVGSRGPPPDFLVPAAAPPPNPFGDRPLPPTYDDLDAIEPSVFPAVEAKLPVHQRLRRESSSEEVRKCTAILCDQVPPVALKKAFLEKHFSKFGPVTKVLVNAKKGSATITFEDHKSAKRAKERGQQISTKLPPIALIHYFKTKKKDSPKAASSSLFGGAPAAVPDSEMDHELQAMGGGSSTPLFSAPKKRAASSLFGKPASEALKPPVSANPFTGAAAVARLPLKRRPINREVSPKPPRERPAPQQQPPPQLQASTGDAHAPTLNQPSQRELLAIITRPALTDADKFDVLDARDKLMRAKGLIRQGTLLKGTCPDICPERERYSRSAKNQLRSYEKINDAINHFATVKEYSRSSADQEVPLSHELRPSPVLSMSMDHLLCNVIQRLESNRTAWPMQEWYDVVQETGVAPAEGSQPPGAQGGHPEHLGEWFEYIWSTTRGIRKDVTQQQLTDMVAVSLVEKCTRMHIVCAVRLVEEGSHNFATKLNDENLTKCLQTLKHMYEDLRIEGVSCPSEPEFRAYDVLMNLNDGDTLRGVQTLDVRVREAPELRNALALFSAINCDNYVRFFRLVRKAPLLQACILQRYFYQVRKCAIDAIILAYTPNSKTVVQFPLNDICTMLAFEDVQECAQCLRLHGIESEVNDNTVYLDRTQYYLPESLPVVRRARNIIESKKTQPWSEVINGGPLPDNPYNNYEPHNSFDENGLLKKESYDASDQVVAEVQMSEEEMEQRRMAAVRARASEVVSAETIEEITKEVVAEEIDRAIEKILDNEAETVAAKEIVEIIVDEVKSEMSEEMAKEVVKEAKNAELKKRLDLENMLEAAEDVAEDIAKEVASEEVKKIAKEKMKDVERDLRLEKSYAAAAGIVEEICSQVVSEEVKKVVHAAVKEAERERERLIQDFAKRRKFRQKLNLFRKWQKFSRKQRQKAETLNNFPAAPAALTTEEQLEKMGPDSAFFSVKETVALADTAKKLFKMTEVEDELKQKLILEPLNLVQIVGEALTESRGKENHLPWKCLISPPSLEEEQESQGKTFVDFFKSKLSRGGTNSDKNLLSCYSAPFHLHTVSICVRVVDTDVINEEISYSDKKRREFLTGTSCVLFLHVAEEEPVSEARNRLEQLLEGIPTVPAIPLLLITTDRTSNDHAQKFCLQALKDRQRISSFQVKTVPVSIFDTETIKAPFEAVSLLAKQTVEPPIDLLQVKTLGDFVEDFLAQYIFSEIYSNHKDRSQKGLCHQNPSLLVNLFNSAVEHMEKVVKNENLLELSWPIPELSRTAEILPSYWNDPAHINRATDAIRAMKLPPFKLRSGDTSWAELAQDVFDYFNKSVAKSYIDASETITRLRRSLQRSYRSFETSNPHLEDSFAENLKGGSAHFLPWTAVVHAFIDHQISLLLKARDEFSVKPKELMVGYFGSDEELFKVPSAWNRNLGWAPERREQTFKEHLSQTVTNITHAKSLLRSREKTYVDPELHTSLVSELEESACFEAKLKAALDPKRQPKRRMDKENMDRDENLVAYVPSQYISAVSILSPSLAQIASSKTALVRPEYAILDKDCRMNASSPRGSVKRKASSTSFFSEGRKARKAETFDVGTLRANIEEDLNGSYAFEKRLQKALGQS